MAEAKNTAKAEAKEETPFVFTQDSISGQVASVPRVYLELFPNLKEVPEDTKPKAPHMHKENVPVKDADKDADEAKAE
jgi:hypothetical protein